VRAVAASSVPAADTTANLDKCVWLLMTRTSPRRSQGPRRPRARYRRVRAEDWVSPAPTPGSAIDRPGSVTHLTASRPRPPRGISSAPGSMPAQAIRSIGVDRSPSRKRNGLRARAEVVPNRHKHGFRRSV